MGKITLKKYEAMVKRVSIAQKDERIIGSTNIGKIVKCLENANIKWMEDLNAILES